MKDQENPRFIQNAPHGVDKYEGKSAERVADAIKSHIEEYNDKDNLAKIIGLDGEWGSGKSNIIRILTSKLGDNYFLFEYDAWGNQEDLQRRSFLEQLTKELIDERILEGETTISKRDGGEETVSWNEKLKYLLAQKKETVSEKYPRISNGMAAAGAVAILTPIFVFIAYAFKPQQNQWWWTLISIFISMIPVLVSLVVWRIACKKDKRYNDLGYLLAIYNDKIENDVNYETISEDEPSVTEFKSWMNDISNFIESKKKNKLIVVFDNMDRLPADKVKELWSSIHTFFSEDGYKNIWVIIPFDKTHLANAFGEKPNGEQPELTCHFINKTFPVIYRVAPPIVTDWKKTFNEFFAEAFGESENEEKLTIQRIFGICKENITPRAIIAFINEIVSLKRTWLDEIPLLFISVFVLKKEIILKAPVINILSGNYLDKIESIVPNNEELQKHISAITFGIEVKLAEQIPLKQYLQKTLKGEPNYDINKYTDNKHFVSILDDEMKDIDPALTEKAILSLSKLESEKELKITPQWNELVKLQLKNEISSLVFSDSHKALLLNADNSYKIKFSKYLYNGYLKQKEFNGASFFSAMEAFENFIKTNNLKISFTDFIVRKNVLPEIFIDYVNLSKSRFNDFKITCDNKNLNDYLIGLLEDGLPNMDFIEYLIKDETYNFTILQEKIESMISGNKLTVANFPELLKTYKLISESKPLPTQLSTAQVQTLISSIKDDSQASYYDLVAMGLVNKQINTAYSEGLDEEVAKVIEYYMTYGKLLILAKDWGSDLLRKTVKAMTVKSFGEKMQILDVLPFFEEIKTAISITPESLLQELSLWEDTIPSITIDNIEAQIPKFNFYIYSTETKNKLTEHINKIAIEKLKTIPENDLYAQRNAATYYWLNCAAILIEKNILKSLPDNLTDFSKKVLVEIASGVQPIPTPNSILDRIIKKASKSKLQPTIKIICDEFCNKTKTINPSLFVYFAENFDFINKMTSRSGDITRNILNDVFSNPTCSKLILDNSSGYINKINEAGDDAEDLKSKIYQMLQNNPTVELIDFASAIGVKTEQESDSEDVKE
jgi:hypothetical protein